MRAKMLCLLWALGLLLTFGAGPFDRASAAPPNENLQPTTGPAETSQGIVTAPVSGRVTGVDVTLEFAIEQELADLGMEGYYTMGPVHARYAAATLPGFSFCGVYFEQWPVRVEPPKGMAQSVVFYMGADKELLYLNGPADLLDLFEASWDPFVGPTGHGNALKQAAKTWLRLSVEFSQDGFYDFSKPVVEVVGNTAYGMVTVEQGGHGYLWVALTIGPTGKISVEEKRHIRPGIRPI
jgi:hypothetical protein